MSLEMTLSIIKPDAVKKNKIGAIMDHYESAGLKVVAARMIHLTQERAAAFYDVHKERPFFGELVDFMTSGPVLVQVLSGENAIAHHRDLMGATNPADAAPGTVRARYADSVGENAVHGSDGPETATREIAFFFSDDELHARS